MKKMADVTEETVEAVADDVMKWSERTGIHPTDEKLITKSVDEYANTLYAFVEEEVNRRVEEEG